MDPRFVQAGLQFILRSAVNVYLVAQLLTQVKLFLNTGSVGHKRLQRSVKLQCSSFRQKWRDFWSMPRPLNFGGGLEVV